MFDLVHIMFHHKIPFVQFEGDSKRVIDALPHSSPSSPWFLAPFSSFVRLALGSLLYWDFIFVIRNKEISAP